MTTNDGVTRRRLLELGAKGLAGGALGLSLPGLLARRAEAAERADPLYDAVIQVFLEGGASQVDTFCPKPGSKNALFGAVALPGTLDPATGRPLAVAEPLRRTAETIAGDLGRFGLGRVDSMVTLTGDHAAAQVWCNCFTEGGLADLQPSTAAVAARYLRDHAPLGVPAVVVDGSLGLASNDAKGSALPTALLALGDRDMSSILRAPVDAKRYARRRSLVEALGERFGQRHPSQATTAAWSEAVAQAHDMTTRGEAAKAFDLRGVPELPGRDRAFARRLLLAQQLVLGGVPFVQVGVGGQDLHTSVRAGIADVYGDTIDPAVAALLANLGRSGRRVLLSFVTEFGRTPQVNADAGRDHWPFAFTNAVISVNQPRFRSGSFGDTGPDGEQRLDIQGRVFTLKDPVRLPDYGQFLWRTLGFDVDAPGNAVTTADGRTTRPVLPHYGRGQEVFERFFPR